MGLHTQQVWYAQQHTRGKLNNLIQQQQQSNRLVEVEKEATNESRRDQDWEGIPTPARHPPTHKRQLKTKGYYDTVIIYGMMMMMKDDPLKGPRQNNVPDT